MKHPLFLLLLFLLNSVIAVGQRAALIDSLEQKITQTDLPDTLRVDCNTQLGNLYLGALEFEKAKAHGENARALAQAISYQEGYLNAINVLAGYYTKTEAYAEAEGIYEEYVAFGEKHDKPEVIHFGHNNWGLMLHRKGDNQKALEHFFAALELVEQAKNYAGMAKYYSNIALAYSDVKQNEKAIEYVERALAIERAHLKKPKNIIIRIINLSSFYQELDLHDKAINILLEGIALNDSTLQHKVYRAYLQNNLGQSYFYTGQIKKAIAAYLISREILQELNSANNVAQIDLNLGQSYSSLGQHQKAKNYLERALPVVESAKEMEFKRYGLEVAAEIYENAGQYRLALDYINQVIPLKDSITGEAQTKAIVEMQTKYETKRKSDSIQLQQVELMEQRNINLEQDLENTKQSNQLLILFIGLAVALLLAIVFFVNYRKKQASNALLSAQKATIETKNEENELLLGEIHHRVKNNLQVISSMLKLHARSIDDQEAKEAIKESTHRIQSIALMHKKLYQQDRFTGVEMHDFVKQLIGDIQGLFPVLKTSLQTQIDVPEMHLDVETALPLSLILNELIVNAFKYAFQDESTPTLSVGIAQEGEVLRLQVKDNGPGVAANWADKNSFGVKLIQALTKQLEGTFEVQNEAGSCWNFTFNRFRLAQHQAV